MILSAGPLAFSGSRLGWADLPRYVRTRIAALAGADVVSETTATSGFSPGYAATLDLGDGTSVFVKAVSPEQNPRSPELARAEARVNGMLPPEVPAPALLWSHDDGSWVLLGFTVVDARAPELPWQPADLDRALDALAGLCRVTAPRAMAPLGGLVEPMFTGWRHLAAEPEHLERAVEAAAGDGDWVRRHLPELVEQERAGVAATRGTSLVHGDLRADNLLYEDGTVWLVDWPHAGAGVPWFDLLAMLPSVAMQGGGDPDAIFWTHPSAATAERDDVRAVLAGMTGYLLRGAVQPAPPGLPNLRPFQLAQARTALGWLRRL